MKIPQRTFQKDVFPFIDDGNVGAVYPVLYGKATSIELVCVNENENPTSSSVVAKFALPEGFTSFTSAYKEIDDVWKAVTSYTINGNILEIACRDRSGSTPRVKLNGCVGYLFGGHSYPNNVIVHLFESQAGIVYNDSNFNTAQFESELLDERMLHDICVYIDDKVEFWDDLLSSIQDGCAFPFELYYDASGRVTARLVDFDRPSVGLFPSSRVMNAHNLSVEKDAQGVYSSVVVNYGKNYSSDSFKTVEDATYKDDVLRDYRTVEEFQDETLLVNDDAALLRAAVMSRRLSREQRNVEVVLEGATALDVYDVITIALSPNNLVENSRTFVGTQDCIIWSITPDPETGTAQAIVGIIDNRTPKESLAAIRTNEFTTVERELSSNEVNVEALRSDTTAAIGAVQNQLDSVVDGTAELVPDDVATVSVIARQDYIDVDWDWNGNALANSLKRFIVQLSKDNGSNWTTYYTTASRFAYYFDRALDGYPEALQLSDWLVRVRAENIYGQVSLGYSPSQAVNLTQYLTWIPPAPVVTAVAEETGLRISWEIDEGAFYGTNKRYEVKMNGRVVAASVQGSTFFSAFNRDIDGYPETVANGGTLNSMPVVVRSITNEDLTGTNGYSSSVDVSGYLTWKPAVPSIATRVNSRAVTISWDTSVKNYGTRVAHLQIAKGYTVDGEGEIVLVADPSGLTRYAPALGLDPAASYENYKEGAAGGYLERSGNIVTFTLPLYGQNEAEPISRDTPYYFWVRLAVKVPTTAAPNAENVGAYSGAELVYAQATSAQDIVRAWTLSDTGEKIKVNGALGAYQIFAAELAAISANLGVITDGAMVGNENNLWAVSRIYEEDGTTVRYYEGTMRVGGTNQYFKVTPVVTGGVVTDYTIDMKVGSFTVSATASDITGTFTISNSSGTVVFTVDPAVRMLTMVGDLDLIGLATESRRIEIGKGRTGNGYAYIDFIGDATYTDHGLRVMRQNGGANTASTIVHRGTGQLELTAQEAGAVVVKTTNAERLKVDADGRLVHTYLGWSGFPARTGNPTFYGSSASITTATFVAWLTAQGYLSTSWQSVILRGTWYYAGNGIINDTGDPDYPNLHLAGCTVRITGTSSQYTIEVHAPTTSTGGGHLTDWVYIYNGPTYSPGWRRLLNSATHVRTAGNVEGPYGRIAASRDEWLRLNDGDGHTNGIYCGNKPLRTDGQIMVGANGEFFFVGADGSIVGDYLTADVFGKIAIGKGAKSLADSTIAIGTNTEATVGSAIAIGYGATAQANYSVGIGWSANATGAFSIGIGYNADTTKNNEINLGNRIRYLEFPSTATQATVYAALSALMNPTVNTHTCISGRFGTADIDQLSRYSATQINISKVNVALHLSLVNVSPAQIGKDLQILLVQYANV